MGERRENPEFSWSNSRMRLFGNCKRAYFYQYYGSHNGWEDDASQEQVDAYRLKHAISLPLAFSDALGKAISAYIKSPADIDPDVFELIINRYLHLSCLKAKIKNVWMSSPKKNPMLIELLNYSEGYKSPKVKEIISSVKKRIPLSITNFFKTQTAKEIKDGAEIVEAYGRLLPNGSSPFSCGSFKQKTKKGGELIIYGRADTVHKVGDKFIATMWHTTTKEELTAEDETLQSKIVAIYLSKRYALEFRKIEVRSVNLITGNTVSYTIDSKDEFMGIMKLIGQSIGWMEKLVENNDVSVNKPKDISEFPQREDHKHCRNCQYFRLCAANAKKKASATGTEAQKPPAATREVKEEAASSITPAYRGGSLRKQAPID